MSSNLATPEYQTLQREWGPKLAAASDEITLNPKLFQRIKAVYDARESAGLDAQQNRLVTRLYEAYVRSGANLNPEQKQQLSAYNQQLAVCSPSSARRCSPTKAPTSSSRKRK
jgi:peptidyl-dipeptidase Dcp